MSLGKVCGVGDEPSWKYAKEGPSFCVKYLFVESCVAGDGIRIHVEKKGKTGYICFCFESRCGEQ